MSASPSVSSEPGPEGSSAASRTGPVIVFADLAVALSALEDAERQTPRLAADEVARYANICAARGEGEARIWRAAHIVLRIVLERQASRVVRGVAYEIAPGGRPQLPANVNTAGLQFSLSHTGQAALIAVSNAGPIGIDLEMTRDVKVSIERRQRILHAAGQLASSDQQAPSKTSSLIEASDGGSENAGFLQAWVRLEALAKASGTGIGRILTQAGVAGVRPAAGIA
ncbi:MAG: hypothetical protein ABL893_07300, partial [Hyphomicrobium sp.]